MRKPSSPPYKNNLVFFSKCKRTFRKYLINLLVEDYHSFEAHGFKLKREFLWEQQQEIKRKQNGFYENEDRRKKVV